MAIRNTLLFFKKVTQWIQSYLCSQIFHFLLLTITIACISGQDNPSSYDDTGLSPNYKPSVKLDPRLRKALLRVLTKLDQEEAGKQNEVSIRDINSQVTTTSNYDQTRYNQPQYNQGTQGPQYNQETQGPQYNQFNNQRLGELIRLYNVNKRFCCFMKVLLKVRKMISELIIRLIQILSINYVCVLTSR